MEEGDWGKDRRNLKLIFPFHYLCANFWGPFLHMTRVRKVNQQKLIKARTVGRMLKPRKRKAILVLEPC